MTRSTYDLSVRTEVDRKSTTKCILQWLLLMNVFSKVMLSYLRNKNVYVPNYIGVLLKSKLWSF
jgi:hypothetical protein